MISFETAIIGCSKMKSGTSFRRHEGVSKMKSAAAEFISKITNKDEVVIIFNNDADGVSSCALVEGLLRKRIGKKSYLITQPMPTEKTLIRKIQTTIPTKLIFLDLAIDQQLDVVKKIGNLCDILVIDHHIINKNLNSKNTVHHNPRIQIPKIYQSTSYLAYKVCGEIEDISDMLWIAAVGMIGDYNLEDSKDIVEEIRKKYSINGKLYDSYLGRLADMIGSARAVREVSCEEMVDVFLSAKGPEDVIKNDNGRKMLEAYKKIENETLSVLIDFESSSEKIGNLILYEIKSNYNLSSSISTRVSEKFKDKIIIIYENTGSRIKISARSQKGGNVGKLLQEAASGLKASAGGHEAAAGATLKASDWGKFKENLVRLIKA